MQTGLGSSRFARRYLGNRLLFLFLRVLRCFTSPGYLPDLRQDIVALPTMGCPIRTSTDLRLLAPPRGFSQLTTSFFDLPCQGIPRVPYIA